MVLDTDLDKARIREIKEIEQRCINNNIEIITSAPTFEIWFVMHYRNNKLIFQTSKDVKKELQNINGVYTESMDMFKIVESMTNKARTVAQSFEQQAIKNREELLYVNPHTSIYKILNAIDEFSTLK